MLQPVEYSCIIVLLSVSFFIPHVKLRWLVVNYGRMSCLPFRAKFFHFFSSLIAVMVALLIFPHRHWVFHTIFYSSHLNLCQVYSCLREVPPTGDLSSQRRQFQAKLVFRLMSVYTQQQNRKSGCIEPFSVDSSSSSFFNIGFPNQFPFLRRNGVSPISPRLLFFVFP